MRRSTVRIVFDKLDQVDDVCRDELEKLVREAAIEVQARAKQYLRAKNAIDTGNLMNSVYTAFGTGMSNRPSSLLVSGKFYSTKQGKYIYVDPLNLGDAHPPPRGRFQAVVAAAASYGMYVEYGTVRMAARPYLTPAAEDVRAIVGPLGRKMIRNALNQRLGRR